MTWIVRSSWTVNDRQLETWWYGPDHGLGTTSGSKDSAARFGTKKAAEDALRSVMGRSFRSRGYEPVKEGP